MTGRAQPFRTKEFRESQLGKQTVGYRVHSTAREWLAAVPPASPSFTAPRTTPLQLPDQDADMPASTHTPKVLGPRPVGPRLLAVGPKAPPIKVAPQAPIGPAPREPKHPKRPPPVPPGYFEGMHMEAVPRPHKKSKQPLRQRVTKLNKPPIRGLPMAATSSMRRRSTGNMMMLRMIARQRKSRRMRRSSAKRRKTWRLSCEHRQS